MKDKWFLKIRSIDGRVRPVIFGIIVMVSGLLLDRWWWKVGGIILIVVFVEAAYRYRAIK